jgi:DNA polymerase-3 subunit gamma/tau
VGRLSAAGRVQALARELAMQAGLQALDESASPPRWTLQVERETLRNPALQERLRLALAAELGHEIELELLPGVPADSPARREAAERQQRQQAAEAAIHADPLVQTLLSQVKTARIVPGSIQPVLPPAPIQPPQPTEGHAP